LLKATEALSADEALSLDSPHTIRVSDNYIGVKKDIMHQAAISENCPGLFSM
jgi:hypothetical protein